MSARSQTRAEDFNRTPGQPGVLHFRGPEEWRAISMDPGYEVSSVGRVRNARTGHILKPWYAGAGYLYVTLWRRRIKIGVHRLVAFAFLGDPPTSHHEVAHNDGNPENNSASNLRWATHAENQADMRRHGTTYYHGWRGETHPTAKLKNHQVMEIRQRCGCKQASRKAVAIEFGVSRATVDLIMQGRIWKHLP